VRYQFIRDHEGEYRVSAMCRVLEVSRSGYYGWKERPESPRTRDNRTLLSRIRFIHVRSREAYGIVKTCRVLREEGRTIGHNRVARLRRIHGIAAKRVRRFRLARAARHQAPPAPNLLDRHFIAHQPNRAWVGDITFIPTREGWLYLAVLIDLYSRLVVGWAMSDRQNRQLAIDALVMAIDRRRPAPGLVHHTDQGLLYATPDYRAILQAHYMLPSMSHKGDCYDNAVAESFFSGLKNEFLWSRDLRTRREARSALFEWIEVFYNRERLHETLDYVSPVRYEEQRVVP
jgi:transposase InsO family protein